MVVWHQQDSGARVELSTTTVWNYVCKVGNLLVGEYDAGPGTRLGVWLPPHWQSVCWVIAAWAIGAEVAAAEATTQADVVVAVAGTDISHGIVTSLDAWGGPTTLPTPPGVLDAGRELRMQPDTPLWSLAGNATTAAMIHNTTLSFQDLAAAWQPATLGSGHYGWLVSRTVADDSERTTDTHNRGLSAPALAAIAQICHSGCLIIVDGDDSFVERIVWAEGIAQWV